MQLKLIQLIGVSMQFGNGSDFFFNYVYLTEESYLHLEDTHIKDQFLCRHL